MHCCTSCLSTTAEAREEAHRHHLGLPSVPQPSHTAVPCLQVWIPGQCVTLALCILPVWLTKHNGDIFVYILTVFTLSCRDSV